jgi:hypothetical protein
MEHKSMESIGYSSRLHLSIALISSGRFSRTIFEGKTGPENVRMIAIIGAEGCQLI